MKLINMLPCFSFYDRDYNWCAHIELPRQRTIPYTLIVKYAYVFYLLLSQFRSRVAFAFADNIRVLSRPMSITARCAFRATLHTRSSLGKCVLHVFGVSADPQVFRTDTCRVIAFMTNLHTPWYGTKMYFPRKTMHQILFTAVEAHHSISAWVAVANPLPTAISLLNIHPKANFGRQSKKTTRKRMGLLGLFAVFANGGWLCGIILHVNLLTRLAMPRAFAAPRGFVMP
jgi:hypothetical protein